MGAYPTYAKPAVGRVLRCSCLVSAGAVAAPVASCGRLLARTAPALRHRQAAASPPYAGWTTVDGVCGRHLVHRCPPEM